MQRPTLNPEKLDEHFGAADIEDLEYRAAKRAQERAERLGKAKADKADTNFILSWAAVAGGVVLLGIGITSYNRAHSGQPIHGPAVLEHTTNLNP